MKALHAVLAAMTATLAYAVPAQAASEATITGAFADACRDFTAQSSKDISHVVLHYADERVVNDEAITSPRYSIDGGAGDEIDVAVVKSGRTTRSFACDTGAPPVALLEIRMSPGCQTYPASSGGLFYWCLSETTNAARTVFVDTGDLKIDMGCLPTEPSCYEITFRASLSTDPDADITGWSIAFDDGDVVGGSWAAAPPDAVTHQYAPGGAVCASSYCHITLTVTDSQGRTATDSVDLAFFDTTPD